MTGAGDDRPAVRPRVTIFRKTIISLGIGALAYFITNYLADSNSAEPQLLGLTLSVFIGGVTLVVQVLTEFEHRVIKLETAQQRHTTNLEHLVTEGLREISEITELFGLVEASALRTDVVIQLVRNATQLRPSAAPLVFRFAQAEISRMSEFLKELGEGNNVTYDGEDRDWMLGLARSVETSIDATSLSIVDVGGMGSVDGGLWTSDLGLRYLEIQRQAIQNGVRIRRIFIVDHPEIAEQAVFQAVYQQQRQMGIEVRVLDAASVFGTHRSSLFDFILFDDVISYEITPASYVEPSSRPSIVSTRLELGTARVRDRVQRFRDLWASARELD